MFNAKSNNTENAPAREFTNFEATGLQLNRRGFVALASASAAALMMPNLALASVAKPNAFRMSLAGDLRKALTAYLEYDAGNSTAHAMYSGKVTIENIAYHITIDTNLCKRLSLAAKAVTNPAELYFDDLLEVANSVPGDSIVVKRYRA